MVLLPFSSFAIRMQHSENSEAAKRDSITQNLYWVRTEVQTTDKFLKDVPPALKKLGLKYWGFKPKLNTTIR
jgi:hypothetical protein